MLRTCDASGSIVTVTLALTVSSCEPMAPHVHIIINTLLTISVIVLPWHASNGGLMLATGNSLNLCPLLPTGPIFL